MLVKFFLESPLISQHFLEDEQLAVKEKFSSLINLSLRVSPILSGELLSDLSKVRNRATLQPTTAAKIGTSFWTFTRTFHTFWMKMLTPRRTTRI